MLLYIKQKCLQRSLQAAQQGQSNTGHLWVGWMHAGLHFFLNSKVTNSSNWFVFLKKLFILYREACSSDGKASAYNAGNLGSIPGSGSSPGEGNGNPLQYSCLENLMDGGVWQATVHEVAKSQTRLSDFTSLHFFIAD